MTMPDWTKSHNNATHWDELADVFCNVNGWFHDGTFYGEKNARWGTDRYTPRPVDPVAPDWPSAPVGATHWDKNAKVWCKDSRFWDDNIWIQGYQEPGYVEKNYVARPVEPASTPWDGTGLPPAGTECEYHTGSGETKWHQCTVKYVLAGDDCEDADGFRAVVWCPHLEKDQIAHLPQFEFRPIRTQDQTDRIQLVTALNQLRGEADMGIVADVILSIGFRLER